MARNKMNMRQMKEAVIEEHERHYIEGLTTYRGVWQRFILPKFYISYSYYMDILGTPMSKIKNVNDGIQREDQKGDEGSAGGAEGRV